MRGRAILSLIGCCAFLGCGDSPPEVESTGEPHNSSSKPVKPWDVVPSSPQLVSGKETYLSECALCHNEGEEGAPALTNKSQWTERAKKGNETLISHAINGFVGEDGEMPAKGGSPHLSDAEVANAALFMISVSSKQQ